MSIGNDSLHNSWPSHRSPVILVVDDELAIRELMKARLEIEGFEVITAANGLDGLEAYKEHRNHVDLVVTDIDMPAMNGSDMIQHIFQMTPAMKVIVASGNTRSHSAAEMSAVNGSLLQKPYTARELTEAVYLLLSSRPVEERQMAC
jgi:DNA-binding NtrC family response regulator